jgi:hypothetical protein
MMDDRMKEAIEDFSTAIAYDSYDPQGVHADSLLQAATQVLATKPAYETTLNAVPSGSEQVSASCFFSTLNDCFSLASFDATPWFFHAEDDALRALQQEDYCGRETAWSGVLEVAKTDLRVWVIVKLSQALPEAVEVCSFECFVNREQAEAWMRVHRPHALLEKSAEEPE